MTYSSISMLPVLLMILLLALDHTSEGIEYHVKPTDPEVAQCPGQPCQTLAEYLENSTWDNTSHARVVFMAGHHRVAQSFLVWYAFNLTLLGSTSSNHTLHDTRPILHIASIGFDNIINLNLTGIIVITSYELEDSPSAALDFTNIFTLRISQIAVHSESGGIYMENVFGNSVIEHSSFHMISHVDGAHISIHFFDPSVEVENPIMLIPNSNNHSKISIQDCIFTNAVEQSIFASFFFNSFPVQIDISNITTLGQQESDIMLSMKTYVQYTVTIRDSLLETEGSGRGIVIESYSFSANQRIQIRNCTLAGHRAGIDISMYSVHKNLTHPAPQIIIKKTNIIRRNKFNIVHDQTAVGLKVSCGDINYAQPSVLLKDVLFSSAVNCRLTAVLPVVQLEFA